MYFVSVKMGVCFFVFWLKKWEYVYTLGCLNKINGINIVHMNVKTRKCCITRHFLQLYSNDSHFPYFKPYFKYSSIN